MNSQTKITLLAAALAVVSILVFLLTSVSAPSVPTVRVHASAEENQSARAIPPAPHAGPQIVMKCLSEPSPPEAPAPEIQNPPEGGMKITLRAIDENDSPVAGLSGYIHWSPANEMDSNPFGRSNFSTSEGGTCAANVPDGAAKGRFFVETKAWRQADYAWFRPSKGAEVVLRVYSTHELSLNINYADGRPYEGKVIYAGGGAVNGTANDGVVELAGVPARAGIVSVFHQRPGYDPLNREVTAAEIAQGRGLTLTIPQSANPMGLLRVKANRPPDAKDPLVEIAYEIWAVDRARVAHSGRFKFVGDSRKTDFPHLTPGDYVVRAAFGGYAAHKEVAVVAGDVVEVDLDWEAGVSVRADLVDAYGTPIPGAVLRRAQGKYATFPAWATPGTQAVAGTDGIVRLTGLSLGTCDLVAEAPGYEQASVKANLAGTSEVNLGRITLDKAVTKVVVEVQNFDPNQAYTLLLGHPTSSGGGINVKLDRDGRAVLEGVTAREYLLAVKPASGVYVAQKKIDLAKRESNDVMITFNLAAAK